MAGLSGRKFWLFAAAATAAFVGEAAAQPAASSNEDIVVTATRRETRLQDVPVAVTPITAGLLQNSGVRDLQDLTSLAPALQFNVSENETSATARLRGIGTQGSNPGLEAAVGIFVDGVYRARNGVALTDLGELAQVEVLRGPQGTLFGKNTSAGLINVTTAGPSMTGFSASAEATAGNYGQERVSGHVNLPLVADKLAARVFAAYDKRDGFLNVTDKTGQKTDYNNRDVYTVRGQLLWEPSSSVRARFIVDYSKRDETCCAAKIYNPRLLNGATPAFPAGASLIAASLGGFGPGGVSALTAGNGSIEDRFGFSNRRPVQQLEDKGASAEFNIDIGPGTLTSVTAGRDWQYKQGQDADFTAADIWYRNVRNGAGFGFKTFTQELRYSGASGPVDWLVGAFYANEILTRADRLQIGADYQAFFRGVLTASTGSAAAATAATNPLAVATGTFTRDDFEQKGDPIALFTHNIFKLDDKTEVSVGVRYTIDNKELRSTFVTPFNGLPLIAAGLPASVYGVPWFVPFASRSISREEKEWSGVASASRAFTQATRGYLSVSRGYKSGGFNLDRDANPLFNGEFVDAYEIGLKNGFMGGDLLLNLDAYYNEYTDFQLNRFNGTQFVVQTIPEVTSQGLEVDAFWRTPLDGLSMQGGVAYTEAEYGANTGWAGPGLTRLPGARLTNAPLWTVTNSFTYKKSLMGGAAEGLAYIDFRYVSDQNTGSDLAPAKIQPGYFLVNGRVGLSSKGDRVGIEVWGRNLFDQEYAQIMFDQPLQTGAFGAFLGDPRTYGVTLRAKY
jgi:outer membrane receptor protein involved in Fe transport